MTQLNYDGKGFYRINPNTKEKEPLSLDSLPEVFDAGERVFFDYNDGLIFHKAVTREQLVAQCERSYNNKVGNSYNAGLIKLFPKKHFPKDDDFLVELPPIHPTKVDLNPVKSLEIL